MQDAPRQQQKSFDFNRAAQLQILERSEVVTRGPGKAVLKALDSYARDSRMSHPSIAEIARNVGTSKDTARRTVHELQALGLLIIRTRQRPNGSHSSNEYEINWLALLELSPPSDFFSDGGGTGTVPGGTRTMPVGYSHRASPITLKRPLKRPDKRHVHGNGSQERKKKVKWRRSLALRDLQDGATILELFGIAVAQGFRSDSELDRQQFARLALYCADEGKSAGLFTWAVNEGRYDFGTGDHDDRARRLIRQELFDEIERPEPAYQP